MMDEADGRERATHRRSKEIEVRSALTRTLAGLYCLICAVCGIVFPVSDALTYDEGKPFGLTQGLMICLLLLSIIIFIYLFAAVFRNGLPCKRVKHHAGHQSSYNVNNSRVNEACDEKGQGQGGAMQAFSVEGQSSEMVERRRVKIAYSGEGVNLYTRIGAAIFALGSIVYFGIRIAEPFESDKTSHCINPFSITVDIVFLVFVVMQTFLIFQHHQVVINRHKAAVRVCLMHLLATNLAVWVSSCTREIVEGLVEDEEIKEMIAKNQSEPVTCRGPETTADRIAPYLFPCVIEYSLIGAAAVYRIYLNVAKLDRHLHDVNGNGGKVHRPPPILRRTHVDCKNGLIGLIGGIAVIAVTIVTVVVFYVLEARDYKEAATYLFLVTDILLILVTMITVVCTFIFMRELSFAEKEKDSFDDKLLVISMGGFYFYSCFIVISSARSGQGFIGACFLIRELLALLQISIQTVTILDGFRRRAETDEHVLRKPGRALITFLLSCNLALWIVNTFEIKRAEVSDIHANHYSRIAWRLVVFVSLPLVIFYRFHSTVCLSDIWDKAYEKEKEE